MLINSYRFAAATTPWTPAAITTALWLDAADAGTVTAPGGVVSQWNDKSGNGRNATQATEANKPTYSATNFNSKACLSFDGNDDFMSIGGSTISGTGYHYAIAIKPGAGALNSLDGDAVFWLRNSYNNSGFLHILYRSNIASKFRTFITSDGNNANTSIKYLMADSSTSEQIITFGGPNTNLKKDGTLQSNGSDTATAANNIFYSGLSAEMGRYFTSSTVYNGVFSIAEFVLAASPTDDDILRIEGYLAHKWGLTANLPAGHPYKSTAPTAPYDADAQTYFNKVEIADGNVPLETATKDAINAFVVGCKADGIWNAIKASCILAGARTLNGALTPLVGTAPTNVGGLFVAGDYNRKTGLVGDGSTKYLDANRAENADPQNSVHTSAYITSVFSSGQYILFGSDNSSSCGMYRGPSSVNTYSRNVAAGMAVASSTGFAGASRSTSASFVSRVFGTQAASTTLVSVTSNSTDFFVFGAANSSSNRGSGRLAFYSIGEALDLAALDARVTALITAFSTAIP